MLLIDCDERAFCNGGRSCEIVVVNSLPSRSLKDTPAISLTASFVVIHAASKLTLRTIKVGHFWPKESRMHNYTSANVGLLF